MSSLETNVVARAAILGVMSGMRSVAGPAAITRRAAGHPKGFEKSIFWLLANPQMAMLATLGQLVEIVLDKLPILPARIAPLPLLGRAVAGATAGAAAFAEADKPAVAGAAVGVVAAVASSYLFYRVRIGVEKALHVPDLVVAVAEDSGVFALDRAAKRTYE